MKKIIFIFFVISFFVQAQQTQSTSGGVELPEFVITGKETYQFPTLKKLSPQVISILSEEFIKPVFSPNELAVKEFSDPLKTEAQLIDSVHFINGNFNFLSGNIYLPTADLFLSFPANNFLFNLELYGNNKRAFVDNANSYSLGGKINLNYISHYNTNFLPSNNFYLKSDVNYFSYNFYGSDIPDYERNLTTINASLGMKNIANKNFIYDFSFNDDYSTLNDINYNENNIILKGYTKINFLNFDIIGKVLYLNQNLTNDISDSESFNYLKTNATFGMSLSDILRVYGGFEYSNSPIQNDFNIKAGGSFNFFNSITIYGEYAPTTMYLNNIYFLKLNRYFNPQFHNFSFYEKKNNVDISVKYEYEKYFEIFGNINIYSADNFPFFSDKIEKGKFEIEKTNTDNFSVNISIITQPNLFGYFIGEINYTNIEDDSNRVIPYQPKVKANLTYGYNFSNGLAAEIKGSYQSDSYTDLTNSNSIEGFFDLGFAFYYRLSKKFDLNLQLNNLLNTEYYLWNNYQEPKLNVLFGINYKW